MGAPREPQGHTQGTPNHWGHPWHLMGTQETPNMAAPRGSLKNPWDLMDTQGTLNHRGHPGALMDTHGPSAMGGTHRTPGVPI